MPLNARNTRTFTRVLLGGILQQVTLLKRNDDQQEGTVRAIVLYGCKRSQITKTGQPIQGDLTANHTTIWMIPQAELDRVGVAYLNVLDRIVDAKNRYWQPESGQSLEAKMFENYWSIVCVRVDPPGKQ